MTNGKADNTLPPMERLLAFCDWERKHNPDKTHIAEWALMEIYRLVEAKSSLDLVALADAYAAGFAAGELAERNRCRWPDCTENAYMICERFTAGTCAGPSMEFMP